MKKRVQVIRVNNLHFQAKSSDTSSYIWPRYYRKGRQRVHSDRTPQRQFICALFHDKSFLLKFLPFDYTLLLSVQLWNMGAVGVNWFGDSPRQFLLL